MAESNEERFFRLAKAQEREQRKAVKAPARNVEAGADFPTGSPSQHVHLGSTQHIHIHAAQRESRTSGIAIIALVLCILSAPFAVFPLIGLFSLPITGFAALLAFIALCIASNSGEIGWRLPLASLIFSIILIAAPFGWTAIMAGAHVASQEIANSKAQKGAPTENIESVPEAGDGTSEFTIRQPLQIKPVIRDELAGVKIRVVSSTIGKVPLHDLGGQGLSKDRLLSIELEINNNNPNKKIHYSSFSGRDFSFERDYGTLTDEFGNSYKRVNFGFGTSVVGNTKDDSIYPLKPLKDVLVFEPPIDSAKRLTLTLPGKNIGASGEFLLTIERADLNKSDD